MLMKSPAPVTSSRDQRQVGRAASESGRIMLTLSFDEFDWIQRRAKSTYRSATTVVPLL
jgi:hypothetical protein